MTADVERLAERLRQVAESQRMDFAQPDVAAMLNDAAEALDGLGALSAERDAGKERADRLKACVEADDALLGAVIEAMGSRPDRDPVIAARELVADLQALRAHIEAAPHGIGCATSHDDYVHGHRPGPCNCWKSAALAGEQPEDTPDDALPFTPTTEDVLVAWTHGFHGDNHNDQRVEYTEAEFWRWLTGELNRARAGKS